MEKTIELLKQADARLHELLRDYELIANLTQEIAIKNQQVVALLAKHLTEKAMTGPDVSKLSKREQEAFDLLGQKLDTDICAEKMGISVKTFRKHMDNIRATLSIDNHYELRALAEQAKRSTNNS